MAMHVQRRNALAVAGHEAWTIRHPWGACGFIFPWNFPFLLVGWGISPALAAGNTVVIKPAEDTPLSTLYLARIAREAGLPDGVINVICGTGAGAGAALSAHPGIRRMSFTGSPEVGRLVGEACGRNLVPVKLELGGKGAAVVFDDVDVPQTAQKLVNAITFHSGQVCCDATRWLVHRSIAKQFTDECVKRLQTVKVGHQLAGGTTMGPVVNAKQRARILSYLEKGQAQGAEAVLPGGPAEVPGQDGFYVKPALLAGKLDNVAAREEIFGPVLVAIPFDDDDDAVRIANDSDYGLSGAVFADDQERARAVARRIRTGTMSVNGGVWYGPDVPFGGFKRSGVGREMGVEGFEEHLETRAFAEPV